MIYYISDTHFGDERIMKLCHRPFASVEEMDKTIIDNWNARVSKDDLVYVLGDIAFNDDHAEIFFRLNGEKILLLGNHDKDLKIDKLKCFRQIDKLITIKDMGRSVCLCHYPMISFENSIYGGYHVFGHIHNNVNDVAFNLQKQVANIFNCGVDENDFEPKTLDELIERKRNNLI